MCGALGSLMNPVNAANKKHVVSFHVETKVNGHAPSFQLSLGALARISSNSPFYIMKETAHE